MATFAQQDWHFWTTNPSETIGLKIEGAWQSEGVGFFSPLKDTPGVVPVYRFYSRERSHHFWSIDKDDLANHPEFKNEGPHYYVFDLHKPQPANTRPLMRYNANWQVKDFFHHFWTAVPEREILEGWRFECPIGYVYEPAQNPQTLLNVEPVERFFGALPSWRCSIQKPDGTEAFAEEYTHATEEEANARCFQYYLFASQAAGRPNNLRWVARRKP